MGGESSGEELNGSGSSTIGDTGGNMEDSRIDVKGDKSDSVLGSCSSR